MIISFHSTALDTNDDNTTTQSASTTGCHLPTPISLVVLPVSSTKTMIFLDNCRTKGSGFSSI